MGSPGQLGSADSKASASHRQPLIHASAAQSKDLSWFFTEGKFL
jgi:hypothetical protein